MNIKVYDKIWYISKNTYVYNWHIIGIFYEKSQYILDLHVSSLGTLVPEEPWCAFYATRHQVYWGLTHVDSCWYSNLISHTRTHTHKHTHTHTHTYTHTHTEHTQGPVDLHTNTNIYLDHLLGAHSSYLSYTEWIIHWYQKIIFHNVFSFPQLFTYRGHISVD